MRVLILTPDVYTRGGISRYTWTLASAFGGLIGADNVQVLALLGPGDEEESPTGFRILGTVTNHLTTVSKFRFAMKAVSLGPRKYDLVVCTLLGLAPVAALMQFCFGVPFWVTCHGIEAWGPLPPAEGLALKRAERVVPISRFTAQKMAEVNGVPSGRMSVLYNAVPDELADMLALRRGATGSQQKRLLSVGVLSRAYAYKGFDTVLRALPEVLEAVPDLCYVIVGKGDDRERLGRLVSELRLGEHVEFAGEVPDADLAEQYRACDVFVLPSKACQVNGRWQGEGFGRVYIEAALAGKPVVGSREGGAAEAVLHGRTGLLVDPNSVSEVAGAIVQLFRDPSLAEGMGCEGRRWARENFTASALKDQLRAILGGAIGEEQEGTSLCAASSE